MIFKFSYNYVRTCQPCLLFTGKPKLPKMPLQPVIVEGPFQQWGLDFMSESKYNLSNDQKWMTCTNFFTKWAKSIPTKKDTDEVVINFMEERILTRF